MGENHKCFAKKNCYIESYVIFVAESEYDIDLCLKRPGDPEFGILAAKDWGWEY